MKKILSLIICSTITFLVACGLSAEEKAAAEKARQDSINAVMAQMAQDSMNAVQAAEQARQDSIMNALKADSIAKAEAAAHKKPAAKPKPKTQLPSEGTPQVGKKKPGAK